MIKVLVADDHPLLRTGLKQLLSEQPDLEVAGEAENSEVALRQLEEHHYDIIVLDLMMPGRGGLDALREIRRQHPALPILILSFHAEDQYAIRTIRAGANGYLSKENAPSEVVKAIRRILTGRKYVSPTLAEMLANSLDRDPERPPHELLSDREFQVLCKIASGMTVSQIAAESALSVKTVSTYRARVLEKMSMSNNSEITRYAIQNGLVA